MTLDIVSLQVVAAIGSLLSGMIYLLPGIASHDHGRWARWWGAGKLAMGVANLGVLLYDGASALLIERLSHIVLVAGFLLCVHGVAKFDSRRVPTGLAVALVVIAGAVMLIPVLDPQDVRWVMAVVGAARGLGMGAIAWVAFAIARRERLIMAWIMSAMFGAIAALFMARAALQVMSETYAESMPPLEPVAAWMLAIAIVLLTLSHFMLLLVDAERSQRLLREQACRDSLTGALNRFGLGKAIVGLRGKLSVLMIDVDRFKALNDVEGHATGDAVLRLVSHLAQRELGDAGTLVRLGGDEFLCLLPGMERAEAQAVATRLSDRFDRALPGTVEGPVYPTLSIGIAHGMIEEGFERLTDDADTAMYAIKNERARMADRTNAA